MNKLQNPIKIRNIAIIVMIAIFFILDRLLKNLALSQVPNSAINIFGRFFSFQFTANPYIAFSLPLYGHLLNALILIIIGLLIYYIFYLILNKKSQKLTALLLTIILFGAISNILDRLLYGYVIDYLELRHFTVFNLADVMISLGALTLLFHYLKGGSFDKDCQTNIK